MAKSFLLKTIILIIALAVVLMIIVAVSSIGSASETADKIETQSFLEQFIVAGGPIVWFVLLPMSLIMVSLAVEHSLTIRRKRLLPSDIGNRLVKQIREHGPAQFQEHIADQKDLITIAVAKSMTKGKNDWFRMRSILTDSLQDQAMSLLRRIEWVNLIGNVSPMVGLFGTVFGMIKLFNAIVIAGGQPQPAQLAEGISVALVTTFWGLFIAIPALAIHSVFRNRIETLVNDAVVETENIMPQIRMILKQQLQPEKPRQQIKEISGKSTAENKKSELTPLR
jgi:biopolymer transport protein ExbB